MTDDTTKFPKHCRPNQSCLEPYRAQIAAQRRSCWPYEDITQWLADTHGLAVDWSTVRNFCDVRNIHKGSGEVGVTNTRPTAAGITGAAKNSEEDEKWNFDTKGPLVLNRS